MFLHPWVEGGIYLKMKLFIQIAQQKRMMISIKNFCFIWSLSHSKFWRRFKFWLTCRLIRLQHSEAKGQEMKRCSIVSFHLSIAKDTVIVLQCHVSSSKHASGIKPMAPFASLIIRTFQLVFSSKHCSCKINQKKTLCLSWHELLQSHLNVTWTAQWPLSCLYTFEEEKKFDPQIKPQVSLSSESCKTSGLSCKIK